MSHSLEDHIGGPVTEERMAWFLVETMPPDSSGLAAARIELLSGSGGDTIASEVLRIGTPVDHWPELLALDPQTLQTHLVQLLTNFRGRVYLSKI